MISFKDNFSKQSATYRKYRPGYPITLFDFLQKLTPEHTLAWDCGTGNGQSAISLAGFYQKVYATDPSANQIKNALPNPRVTYQVEKAEQCSLPDNAADLITVAQALHWFNFDDFFTEAKRVLKPNGILAVWCYDLPCISPEIDKLIRHFHDNIVGEFWQPENKLIDNAYATIPFPFAEIKQTVFEMKQDLSLNDLSGLLQSWSAVQRYQEQTGKNPVDEIAPLLAERWGNPEKLRTATWKATVKTGRNS